MNLTNIARDLLQILIGFLIVSRLGFHHGSQINRLHVAGRALQHRLNISLRLVILAHRQRQAGAVEAGLHDGRLRDDHIIQHRHRPWTIVLQPQELRLRQQSLRRFRLRRDRVINLRLSGIEIRPRHREAGVSEQRLHRVGRDLLRLGEGFLGVVRPLQANHRIATRHQDRGIKAWILAFRLNFIEQFLIFAL